MSWIIRWLRHSMIRSSWSLLVWRCEYWWSPCILSSWRWRHCLLLLLLVERYFQGGTVHTYLVQLHPKPSDCHGLKASKLDHLDVWRLRTTDPLTPWKLVPEPSLLLSILCRWPSITDVCSVHSSCMQGRADLERELGCHTRMYGGDTCWIPDDVSRHSDGFIKQSET